MTKVVVTGGSGLLGGFVIGELVEHQYDIVNADMKTPKEPLCRHVFVNSRSIGDLYYAFHGADAVIHLAAIPSPGKHPDDTIVENNVVSTYNVLEAASTLGIQKVVLASSICAYGMVNARHPFEPQYLPLDEDHPLLPQDSYGLSKVLDETSAAAVYRRCGTQVVSLRFTTVIAPEIYPKFRSVVQTGWLNERVLWSYVDARDAATACRLGIEAEGLGAIALNIGAADIGVEEDTASLVKGFFPDVRDIRSPLAEHDTLFDIQRARNLLGWGPKHSWRDYV